MGVEVESTLVLAPVENGSEANGCLKENVSVPSEPIKFGSHDTEEPIKEEVKSAPSINLPKDAVVEDWPEPQQIHSFFFVKYRFFEDPKLKAMLELAEKDLQKKNQAEFRIIETLKAKRAARSELFSKRKPLSVERDQYKSQIDENLKVMKPLNQALGKLRGGGGRDRDRGSFIFSSEAELNNYIKSLEYHIVHESIPLSEEKQILREIKQLEATREKVIANAAERAKIQESMGEKESIQSQVKLLSNDLDGVRKEKQNLSAKLKGIDDELDSIKNEIDSLENELTALNQERRKVKETIMEIRKQRDEGNSSYITFKKLSFEAKQLAVKKDITSLKELTETEVEKFMALWCSDKSFREDYEKRILQALDMKGLCKDGRMRNPGEKPLASPEPPILPPETTEGKPNQKPSKEVYGLPSQPDASLSSEAGTEKKKPSKQSKRHKIDDDDEEIPGVTDLPKSKKDDEVDEEKLKQIKKEEELAKFRLALERKKKKEEKAAAKAELKAQREAEKKLKKKAKKKGGGGGAMATDESTEEASEAATEDAEQDKADQKVAEAPTEAKLKEKKVGPLRQRPRPKGSADIPKVLLKRKKTNYWAWASLAAAVAVLLILAVGYKFFA